MFLKIGVPVLFVGARPEWSETQGSVGQQLNCQSSAGVGGGEGGEGDKGRTVEGDLHALPLDRLHITAHPAHQHVQMQNPTTFSCAKDPKPKLARQNNPVRAHVAVDDVRHHAAPSPFGLHPDARAGVRHRDILKRHCSQMQTLL